MPDLLFIQVAVTRQKFLGNAMNQIEKTDFFATTLTGHKLERAAEMTLSEFLGAQATAVQSVDVDDPYFNIVADEISLGMGVAEKAALAADFARNPMIQMADGALLLTDYEVFLNNMAADTMVSKRQGEFLVNQQCSTITNVSSTSQQAGPAFTQWEGRVTKVFDVSSNKLRHSTPETLSDVDILLADTSTGHFNAPNRLRRFVGQAYPTAALALQAMNMALWPFSAKLALNGEDLSARVAARALQSTDLRNQFEDPELLNELLVRRDTAINDPSNFILRDTTDFFYAVSGARLHPVRIAGGSLVDRQTDEKIGIHTAPDDLAEALLDGRLFPDLQLAYAVMCLKPKIAALGGASQQEYLPRIAPVFQESAMTGHDLSKMVGGIIEVDALIRQGIDLSIDQHKIDADWRNRVMGEKVGLLLGCMSHLDYFPVIMRRRLE